MHKVIIFGIGDLANLLHYYLSNDSVYEVVGFCVNRKYLSLTKFNDLPVYAFEDLKNSYGTSSFKVILALGYSCMRSRKEIYEMVLNSGFELINYISSKAFVAKNVKLGFNNIILQGVVLEPNVEIGDNNIVWSSTTICHDVKVGSHNFIAAGSVIGGFSKIENLCFIGFSSTILHNIHVLNESLIGAKSLQLENTVESSRWVGSPSKLVGFHHHEGIKVS